jgi:VanZ family protein
VPKKIYLAAAVVWCFAIAICCLISMNTFKSAGINTDADKSVHFSFYVIFVVIWYLGLRPYFKDYFRLRIYVFLLAFLFGVLIEICQSLFTTDRTADIKDVLSNTFGAALGILLIWIVSKIKK